MGNLEFPIFGGSCYDHIKVAVAVAVAVAVINFFAFLLTYQVFQDSLIHLFLASTSFYLSIITHEKAIPRVVEFSDRAGKRGGCLATCRYIRYLPIYLSSVQS